MFISEEKKQAATLEKQKNEGITGNYERRYTFNLMQQQWIAPGFFIKNRISGQFDCGLIHNDLHTGQQTWSVELRGLTFDWNPQAAPEIYFLFAYPSRMDIRFDKEGQLIGGSTWIDYKSRWYHNYHKEIKERIADRDQADQLLSLHRIPKDDHRLATGLLVNNPLIAALGRQVRLNQLLRNDPEPAGTFGERFKGNLIKHDYFGKDIHLPLKTVWIHCEPEAPLPETWIHLGGLDTGAFQSDAFLKQLRLITQLTNPQRDGMKAEFGELFQMQRNPDNMLQLNYARLETETILPGSWIKSEELEIKTDQNGINYGTK